MFGKVLRSSKSTKAEAACYAKHHSEKISAQRVSAIVDEMIAEKRKNGLSQVYLSDLRYLAMLSAKRSNVI